MSSYIPFNDARTLLLAAELLPVAHIHFSNEGTFREPQPPDLWMSVEAYSNNIDMIDLGAEAYAEEGTIRIMCVAPAGWGTDGLRTLAKSVCDVFRGLGPRNPQYLNASISEHGITEDDGIWFAMSVSVDFRYEDQS